MIDPAPLRSASLTGSLYLAMDIARRVRYRRAELRRLAPAQLLADGSGGSPRFEWISVAVKGVPRQALTCPVDSRVIYDVTLPADAVVRSWCAVDGSACEFEIQISAGGRTTSASRCAGVDATGVHWHAIEVAASAPGPARIVFAARREVPGTDTTARAVWAHPRIESPRPPGDLVRVLRRALAERGVWRASKAGYADPARNYQLYARYNAPSRTTLRAQRGQARSRSRRFTVITVLGGGAEWRSTADSVLGQSYANLEWLLVASEAAAGSSSLQRLLKRDRRVRVVIAADSSRTALNLALTSCAGEFVGLLDAGDTLSPDALFEMSSALDVGPRPEVIYSDEDQIARGGTRVAPAFKPEWSPELLLSSNYIGRLSLVRREAAVSAGGFRDSAADAEWELFLRLASSNARFRRVPRCLYHRGKAAEREEPDAACADVAAHVAALGRAAQVTSTSGGCRLTWPPGNRLVSIVIPNRNALDVLSQAVEGILHRTDYARRELVIVDNGSTEAGVLALYDRLRRDGTGQVVAFPGAFNFSAACNRGAAAARGDLLLFLNNDVEVIDPSWLEELVRWAELPEIGIVGAKLLYPDRTIQHAGVVFGIGLVGHIFARAAEGTATAFGSPESYRNYLAVTGACQMMRRSVFEQLGGFDERFRLSFSDVVLCMEAWKAGYRVMYTPYARLIHHESYSRKKEDSAEDMLLLAHYLDAMKFSDDPFFHPELDPKSPIPAVRPPLEAAARQVVTDYVERVLATAG